MLVRLELDIILMLRLSKSRFLMLRRSKSRFGRMARQKQFSTRQKAEDREVSALFKGSKRRQEFCSEHDGKSRGRHTLVDRISMLPDELLVFILSHLTFKQAAATGVLSHRWRYVWTFTPRLDFDGTKLLLKADMATTNLKSAINKERLNYVGWVNHVIALRKDSNTTVEYFKVYFNLTKTYDRYIDEWVRYALERKVQTLELNLTDEVGYRSRKCNEYYTFPYKFLSTDEGDCSKYSQPSSLRHCNSIHFKHLKKILLNYVNVNGDALEFFLYNCPLLEDLSVSESGELLSLKITGPFSSLRCLEISMCPNLNSVEIRDANLVCLKYKGKMIHFFLENVPMLVNFTVGGMLTDHMGDVVALFSSIFPQLEIFKIYTSRLSWEETETFYSAVKLINLKQLVVNVMGPMENSLLPVTNLICASPRLQRFVLEADHMPSDILRLGYGKIGRSYAHLKEVMFVGYRGAIIDVELAMHFVDNAVALEEIVIDPRGYYGSSYMQTWAYIALCKDTTVKREMKARTRAEQLRNKVPRRINLRILS